MTKQSGVSLLEILLVICIIATITVMAVRYFSQAMLSQRVEQAVTQVKQLTHASYQWLQVQKQENFAGGGASGVPISVQALRDASLLPEVNQDRGVLRDPWGGLIVISPGSDQSYVRITLQSVPIHACRHLQRELQSTSHIQLNQCNGEMSTYAGEF